MAGACRLLPACCAALPTCCAALPTSSAQSRPAGRVPFGRFPGCRQVGSQCWFGIPLLRAAREAFRVA